jgi:hypothetical protein
VARGCLCGRGRGARTKKRTCALHTAHYVWHYGGVLLLRADARGGVRGQCSRWWRSTRGSGSGSRSGSSELLGRKQGTPAFTSSHGPPSPKPQGAPRGKRQEEGRGGTGARALGAARSSVAVAIRSRELHLRANGLRLAGLVELLVRAVSCWLCPTHSAQCTRHNALRTALRCATAVRPSFRRDSRLACCGSK